MLKQMVRFIIIYDFEFVQLTTKASKLTHISHTYREEQNNANVDVRLKHLIMILRLMRTEKALLE